ncbi:MAG: hypothetical protein JXC32_20330 [Anaerolineae bacterium]|nr:hypothetical protein [Anaerolineae bacterium]
MRQQRRCICPVSDARRQLWYEDTFDRETPRQVQSEGRGLASGLAALWSYHLHEGVDAQGRPSFSRFNLWWTQRCVSIEIAEDPVALARLRDWLLTDNRRGRWHTIEAGDLDLLSRIAAAHSRLVLASEHSTSAEASRPILTIAKDATDRAHFAHRLAALARNAGVRSA